MIVKFEVTSCQMLKYCGGLVFEVDELYFVSFQCFFFLFPFCPYFFPGIMSNSCEF
uniref:Uncharacterized protein n=1 Tax=Rhizophora mucronata TaxID=61149 RepID=A0A2P2NLW4_RHIMU